MHATPRIALIADDLTGAMDSAIPFQIRGLRCVVATAPEHLPRALQQGADLVAVSLNSRDLTAETAADLAAKATEMLAPAQILFKKIDSRLKGHVVAETSAILATRQSHQMFLCPAIPAMGRFVKDGALMGFGVAAPIPLPGRFGSLRPLAPDIASDADLALAIRDLPTDTVFVGARGLAEALANHLTDNRNSSPPSLPLPISFVVGSRDPITLAQVASLRAAYADLSFLPAPNGAGPASAPLTAITLLQALPGHPAIPPAEVTTSLAASALRLAVTGRRSLVITGGETAAALLAAMGIGVLDLLGEALPGMVLARSLDAADAPLILTKSGGFGAADSFCRLLPTTKHATNLKATP